ncbi:hypothetical protein Tco_0623801 [Tanacetum coccineum]|uniref:Retrovirus-related Pol polyprotein from transposon TNT 1-94-like beta-barrel domain-containing protein n=1 Tax=Tanacetum coccineum TaxID=301880 RepID=A0ABQ4WC14_9ASTR
MSFVGLSTGKGMNGSTIKVHGSTLPGSVSRNYGEKGTEHVFSPPMSYRSNFVITRKKLIHNSIDESKKPSLKPSPKSDIGYVKTESRSKTPPPRRNISSQPRYNTPQSRRNSRQPIHQNFYPINWNNQQNQGFVCLRTCLEPDECIKDSGCSKHMTGNKSLFSTYKAYDEEIYGGKEEDVGLDELGEGGKGVVSKIGEFGGDLGSELFGDRGGDDMLGISLKWDVFDE